MTSPHHVSKIPIRWGDMDALGHVNNTVYFRYMEQARVDWLVTLDIPLGPGADGFILAQASCNFLRPLTSPGVVEVRMDIGTPGRSSVPARYVILMEGASEPSAEGTSTLVWTSGVTGRSTPLPDDLRRRISGSGTEGNTPC